MSKKPPVPPANRSPKGTGSDPVIETDDAKPATSENPREQGQAGNIRQNTTHQGYRQDR
jgi:hypothetical protein